MERYTCSVSMRLSVKHAWCQADSASLSPPTRRPPTLTQSVATCLCRLLSLLVLSYACGAHLFSFLHRVLVVASDPTPLLLIWGLFTGCKCMYIGFLLPFCWLLIGTLRNCSSKKRYWNLRKAWKETAAARASSTVWSWAQGSCSPVASLSNDLEGILPPGHFG